MAGNGPETPSALSGSLRGAPSLIEHLWPAQKLSAEAQKERKAGSSQTLTSLGSYWKGRKPLILVRACILGALLPASNEPERDLEVFEALMQIDDEAFGRRDRTTKPAELVRLGSAVGTAIEREFVDYFVPRGWKLHQDGEPSANDIAAAADLGTLKWRPGLDPNARDAFAARLLALLPYADRVRRAVRPEELGPDAYEAVWARANAHLGTTATSLEELVNQLSEMRYGRLVRIADTFSGGGSIPFEAARLGANVYASDLNPIACMLTWGGRYMIGADAETSGDMRRTQQRIAADVDDQIRSLDIEFNAKGDRAKAYLYCLEATCPQSGWRVPLLPTLVISKPRNVVARLVPDFAGRRYDIAIDIGVSAATMAAAEKGTVRDGAVVHSIGGEEYRTSIKALRGDYRGPDGSSGNALRPWEKADFRPRESDVFQERLYCVQWITSESLTKKRWETYFSAVTPDDVAREERAAGYVQAHLAEWQRAGLAPDKLIEDGHETEGPIRTMGWTHWHHFFNPRQLIVLSALKTASANAGPASTVVVAKVADRLARNTRWDPSGEKCQTVFDTQGLKTFFNYACRAFPYVEDLIADVPEGQSISAPMEIRTHGAKSIGHESDIYITDPPYADAVHYHEITEFFISWLRTNPAPPFDQWTWDSRRPLAIKGDGEDFRREMVAAYKAMTQHLADDGLQIVMFTHQSGAVWADMAQIFWGAGLQVRAAWYIATETTSELRKGGYVQGTVILVLRKRSGGQSGYEDEIVQDVRAEVATQIDTLVGLNQTLKGAGRMENLFEDADLQMAGYAAALRVLTGYTKIDGRDMTAEAVRPRRRGEISFVDRVIEFAVGVANEHMVPDGISSRLWQLLSGPERFYLKMLDLESVGLAKLDNYQNFARAFRVGDYMTFMGDIRPNSARLKTASEFGTRSGFDIPDFGQGLIRSSLLAINELIRDVDPDRVLSQLRDILPTYFRRRDDLIEISDYIARQRGREDDVEGRHAGVLANLIRNERF